jgi:hypothetical protein
MIEIGPELAEVLKTVAFCMLLAVVYIVLFKKS